MSLTAFDNLPTYLYTEDDVSKALSQPATQLPVLANQAPATTVKAKCNASLSVPFRLAYGSRTDFKYQEETPETRQ